MIPICKDRQKATPDDELLSILRYLDQDDHNEVVLVSGRDIKTLDSWFKTLDITIIAEHGAFIKEKHESWKITESLETGWEEKVYQLLQDYLSAN